MTQQYRMLRSDDVYAGVIMTRHMLELGHRRIAFVTRAEVENSEDRIAGYFQALAEANIVFDEQLIARTETCTRDRISGR